MFLFVEIFEIKKGSMFHSLGYGFIADYPAKAASPPMNKLVILN